MRLPTGEKITLPFSNHFASEVFVTHADVDWGSEKLLYSLLSRKGVFLDVGAHIGYYSLYMLPRVAAVYSFEPDPRARALLSKNVADAKNNIEIVACAVGAALRKARFTLEGDCTVSRLSGEGEKPNAQIEVDVLTLDEFVNSRNLVVEAIKIDAEGHDTSVIAGSLAVLEQQEPIVLTEAEPNAVLFCLTDRIKYRVFAYVRHPTKRTKSFTELFSDGPRQGETKMLFLAPQRRAEEILERVREFGDARVG